MFFILPNSGTCSSGPVMSVEAYLTTLERQGLTQTVSILREHIA
jgi:hypothetical protein